LRFEIGAHVGSARLFESIPQPSPEDVAASWVQEIVPDPGDEPVLIEVVPEIVGRLGEQLGFKLNGAPA